MGKVYFKIDIKSLTNEMIEKSTISDPYVANRTLDGKYIMLSYEEDNVPLDLFKMGIPKLSESDAKTELNNGLWYDDETDPALINNHSASMILAQAFSSKELPDAKKLYRRKHGMSKLVPANSTANIDFVVPYPQAKITKAEIINCSLGDTVNLTVHDDANGTYSTVPNYQLNQFGYDVYMPDGTYHDESKYDADLYSGMIVRVTYTNNTAADKTVGVNLTLHEVK